MANTFIIRGRVLHDIPPTGHFLFCSHHLTLCTLNPLTTDTSEMSPISLSFDDTETEALQESLNKSRMHIPTPKKCVCAPVHAHMDASTWVWERACMCVHMKCLVYQLSHNCVDTHKALTQCSRWCFYSRASFWTWKPLLHLERKGS